jgi:hypothetical protein
MSYVCFLGVEASGRQGYAGLDHHRGSLQAHRRVACILAPSMPVGGVCASYSSRGVADTRIKTGQLSTNHACNVLRESTLQCPAHGIGRLVITTPSPAGVCMNTALLARRVLRQHGALRREKPEVWYAQKEDVCG